MPKISIFVSKSVIFSYVHEGPFADKEITLKLNKMSSRSYEIHEETREIIRNKLEFFAITSKFVQIQYKSSRKTHEISRNRGITFTLKARMFSEKKRSDLKTVSNDDTKIVFLSVLLAQAQLPYRLESTIFNIN